jgi:hypothetical protein
MRIVVATQSFHHVGGTETYVLTVAEQLQRLGHRVRIYAQQLGDMAMLARDRGGDVVADPDELGSAPDVLLTQDAVSAYELGERFPGVAQVFVNHSATFDPQLPPLVPGVVDAVVVMSERFRAHLEALDSDLRIVRLRQPIDTERLVPRRPPSEVPRRALLLGNYLSGDARRLLVDAWTDLGLEVVQVGVDTRPSLQPEDDIAAADIVVGKARAVLDAMSCGRPAYVYDAFGGDGWVTADTYDAMEADALAGQAFPDVIDGERLRKDLAAYDPMMGHVNRTLVLKHHQARTHVHELVRLCEAIIPRPAGTRPVTHVGELARQMRLRWQADQELVGLRAAFAKQTQRVETELAVAQHAMLAAQAEAAHRQAELAISWEDQVRLDAELAAERAAHDSTTRRRDRAQARGRAFKARYDTLLSSRWVRLGAALRLVRVPTRSRP